MSYNVLIADDSKVVRAFISKTLGVAGVDLGETYEASNGKEALRVLEEHWVDIIFLDIYMPEMTGVEVVDEMVDKGLLQKTPVIMISSQQNHTLIEELKDKGVRAYLKKPITPELLKKVVDEALGEISGDASDK